MKISAGERVRETAVWCCLKTKKNKCESCFAPDSTQWRCQGRCRFIRPNQAQTASASSDAAVGGTCVA